MYVFLHNDGLLVYCGYAEEPGCESYHGVYSDLHLMSFQLNCGSLVAAALKSEFGTRSSCLDTVNLQTCSERWHIIFFACSVHNDWTTSGPQGNSGDPLLTKCNLSLLMAEGLSNGG